MSMDKKAYRVFYQHPKGGYRIMREVYATGLEDVFYQMQGEIWSPDGIMRDYVKMKGVRHTSMMVGDLAVDVATGKAWICADFGWKEFTGCDKGELNGN